MVRTAKEQGRCIYVGALILQDYASAARLVALDKALYCDGPTPDRVKYADIAVLKGLGWTWSAEQHAWEFRADHGW